MSENLHRDVGAVSKILADGGFVPVKTHLALTDLLLECNPSHMSRGCNRAKSEMSHWSMF